jgi:hypothetical protein
LMVNWVSSCLSFFMKKKYINIQGELKLRKPLILMVNWVSSCLSFFPEHLHCCYIYFSLLPTKYNYNKYSLEPCALNAEFLNFVLYWDFIKFPYFADTTEKKGYAVKPGPKTGWRQCDFTDNSSV